ncbi:hypothetical protein ARMGADRAFT_1031214 [Armillaria gallica]|uniref:Uncharacterized protein n=1 Tax=Armillaria gallica TaxID=47427 RepID=A0A2H3DAU8_ARMGA|nr:hypothetical protein ARMGADRAFT_1031214 [Armillaria gallica]
MSTSTTPSTAMSEEDMSMETFTPPFQHSLPMSASNLRNQRNLIPVPTTSCQRYMILAANHNPIGAVEVQVLIVQAISDHFMAWSREQIQCALTDIPASSYYCLWYPILHFLIYSATKLLTHSQVVSAAQMGLMETMHTIFVIVDPISTSTNGGHTHYSYISAIILTRVLVQWACRWAHHTSLSECELDMLAIRNISYQLVDSDMASSVVAILLVMLKPGTGVHIKKYHKKNAANDNNDNNIDNDFDIMPFGLSHASLVGISLLGTVTPDLSDAHGNSLA